MRKRIAAGLVALAAGVIVATGGSERVVAQGKAPETKASDQKWLYGNNFKVRPGGETDWPKAVKFGVETFLDHNSNAIISISEGGSIAVIPDVKVGTMTKAKWLTAHDLATRKAGEAEFTQKTKRYGVELFRDYGVNKLLYLCESKAIAYAPIPPGLVTDRGPKWHHAFEPRVRGQDQQTFENARRIGVEVFKDENTGGLLYVTETGGIATAPAPATPPDPKKIAPPKTAYGLVLRVRPSTEKEFNNKSKRISVEVFEDPNANVLFYLTETGYLATVPNPGKFSEGTGQPTWLHGMGLKTRKPDEAEFSDKTTKFGVEVFRDNRTGNLMFITETGSIAVLPK